MDQHEINAAMVRAGIDLDKLHKLTPAQLHALKALIIHNEMIIDVAIKRTRRHMTTSLFRK